MNADVEQVASVGHAILDEIEHAVVGKRHVLETVLVGLLADGHVLLEDLPGVAKTLIARSFATTTGLELRRIQFTPDLLPGDITGSSIYDQRRQEFEFRPGPLFANLVLGDEINRAPPKTQAALLEAMQERQVTTDGETRPLPSPFLVIATQNPIEVEGTYPLPEAQLDRFLLRVSVGYPSADDELRVLTQRVARRQPDPQLSPVVDTAAFQKLQAAIEQIQVSEPVGRYIIALTSATRHHRGVAIGVSPRGTLALLAVARATAALDGRDFVLPDDVKRHAIAVLAHRVSLTPEQWVRGSRTDQVVQECLDQVPAPSSGDAQAP